MSHVALLIALEDYADASISSVPFAAADLAGFSNALSAVGFDVDNQVCRRNGQATKSGIESDLRKLTRRLTHDDTLLLFYVGHGFSLSGANYLSCYDTRPDDLAETSLSIQRLLETVSSCKCRRVILFLDAAHTLLPNTKVLGSPISIPFISSFRSSTYNGWLMLQGVPHDMLYVNPQIWVLSGQ